MEWLKDTLAFMAERYPQLSDLHMAQLEMMGRQFVKPAIPHGAGKNAQTIDRTKMPAPEPESELESDEPTADEAEPVLAEPPAAPVAA